MAPLKRVHAVIKKALWFSGLILFCTAITTSAQNSKNARRSVAELATNETVKIIFHSKGCFNDQSYTLKMSGADLRKIHISGTDRQSSLWITAEELKKLDRTLDFYRSNPVGQCTTKDSIAVYWMKFGLTLKRESFEDSTCSQDFIGGLVRKIPPGPTISQGK
ncbi:MAG: hypothetical protein ACHQ51_05645 [Elusimicrobiota bacterium]